MKIQSWESLCFRSLTELHFGSGLRHHLPFFLDRFKPKSILLVADPIVQKNPLIAEWIVSLQKNYIVHIVSTPSGEPDIYTLDTIKQDVKKHAPELVIGLGGGSTMDMAKGLAVVYTNPKHASDYQGLDLLENPGLPCITIPTLFGSGAEITPSAVMINHEKKKKGGINGRYVFPTLAIVDPELGQGIPKSILGATACDALVHAVEGYIATCATPLSKLFSKEATQVLCEAIRLLSHHSNSIEGLEKLAYGALLAINGLMHSEASLAGPISYPMGTLYAVPHGVAGGRLLKESILFNAAHKPGIFNDILPNSKDAATELCDTVEMALSSFSIVSLRDYFDEKGADVIATTTFENFKPTLGFNPVPITTAQILNDLIVRSL